MLYLWLFLALIGIFAAIIIIKALLFRPKPDIFEKENNEILLNEEKIVADLSDMIKCRTVSHRNPSRIDRAEYEKFQKLLKERFPLIHEKSELKRLGNTGLLYFIKGSCAEEPSVCMAHYDVVPVDEKLWSRPAFDGLVEDGMIWGRGTLDTKGTLCALMEALEMLLEKGYIPKNDLYLSFSGEEEVDGSACKDIVSYLKEKGVRPAVVLDEGGAVVDDVFPGVSKRCAVVGIAEKGDLNIDLTLVSDGGHSSTPPSKQVTVRLASAITRLEKKPFKRRLTKASSEMFNTLGRHSSFAYRLIFANLWCFFPLLDIIARRSGGELNAVLRTTTAVTRLKGSKAYNVLPSKATCGINLRLMEGDTINSALERIRRITGEKDAVITVQSGNEASPCSDTDNPKWYALKSAIKDTWNDAVVSPYLMMACSDSRNYCEICDRVYRFSAMYLSKEQRGMIHGNNERLSVEELLRTTAFYVRFLKLL